VVGPEDPRGAEALALMEELDADLRARYPGQAIHPAAPGELSVFLVARLDGRPAGCGALRLLGEQGEVVRMYVRPGFRRRGVARAVLRGLEAAAREAGLRSLHLETGDNQAEAVALYRSEGFVPTGPYGPLASCPHSLFFRKALE